MTPEHSFQRKCLEPLLSLCGSYHIPAKLLEPDDKAPYYTLIARFPRIGESHYEVPFELTLPTGTADIANGNYLLLLTGTLDKEVWKDAIPELYWLANRLNSRIPLGVFVVLEDEAQLLFRHSLVMSGTLSEEQQVKLVDQQLGMIIHQLNLFMELVMEVAAGREEARPALKAHPMGAQLFPHLT